MEATQKGAAKPKPQSPFPRQAIESQEGDPLAIIITDNGFIGGHLAQLLLQLPLKVLIVESVELQEIKHLQTNARVSVTVSQDAAKTLQELPTQPQYVFCILDKESARLGQKDTLELVKDLTYHLKRTAAKFELVIVDNSPSQPEVAGRTTQLIAALVAAGETGGTNTRTATLINPYGPLMSLAANWDMAHLLYTLHQKGYLEIPGDGLRQLHPLYIEDACHTLAKAMFTEGARGEQLTVGGNQEITTLNLAYRIREEALKEFNTLAEIRFTDVSIPSIGLPTDLKSTFNHARRVLNWTPRFSLEEGLSQTLRWLSHKSKKIEEPHRKDSPPDDRSIAPLKLERKFSPSPPRHTSKLFAILATIVLMSALPAIAFLALVGSGGFFLSKGVESLLLGDIDKSLWQANIALRNLRTAQSLLALTAGLPIPIQTFFQEANHKLEVAILTTDGISRGSQIGVSLLELKNAVLAEGASEPAEKIMRTLSLDLNAISTNLSLLDALLKSQPQGDWPLSLLTKDVDTLHRRVRTSRSEIEKLKMLVELLPQLIGEEEKRTYLVLLQNSAELRPTGGFIGSYALVSFEKGKLQGFNIEDIYTADGQLKGHVEPPEPIKNYLGEAGWYLRDANWDPDFPTSARRIEWFFEKETGIQVDGTIAVNLFVARELLERIGPINLPDYEGQVSGANLFPLAEYYSEVNFFPGSSQKKDFLSNLGRQLFYVIKDAKPRELIEVGEALFTSLNNEQLLIALRDPTAQRAVRELGWDGSLKDLPCPNPETGSCPGIFLAINEANLGVNKANYYIKRAIEIVNDVRTNPQEATLTIHYKNESPSPAWPAGPYKNYLRIYTNRSIEVNEISVDGNKLNADERSLSAEHEKQVIGFLLTVPVQEKRTVSLKLRSQPHDGDTIRANLFLQKQPGTPNDLLRIVIRHPQGMKVASTNLPLQEGDGDATINQTLEKNLHLEVEFQEGK